jgi:sodium/potassium/calcium exchanger 6
MGFSACFGGPLLNILLGVGVSGTYMIQQSPSPHYYALTFSPTLISSAIGLLMLLIGTLFFVPMNDYHLTKRGGWLLIASYAVIMAVNVAIELIY